MEILEKFETASDQKINGQKFSITFSSKIPRETKKRAKRNLQISKEGGLEKYLGLPEHFGRRKKDLFTQIAHRIQQKAISYSSKFFQSGEDDHDQVDPIIKSWRILCRDSSYLKAFVR